MQFVTNAALSHLEMSTCIIIVNVIGETKTSISVNVRNTLDTFLKSDIELQFLQNE